MVPMPTQLDDDSKTTSLRRSISERHFESKRMTLEEHLDLAEFHDIMSEYAVYKEYLLFFVCIVSIIAHISFSHTLLLCTVDDALLSSTSLKCL